MVMHVFVEQNVCWKDYGLNGVPETVYGDRNHNYVV